MASASEENVIDEDLHHYDFTTASPWEVFIARIEELICEWKLSSNKSKPRLKGNAFHCLNWRVLNEEISFAETKFVLSYHRGELDSEDIDMSEQDEDVLTNNSGRSFPDCTTDYMSSDHDFVPVPLIKEGSFETKPHILARWYGLREFIVLSPVRMAVTSESKIKTLLSSFNIAASNTKCEIPMFVQALEYWQSYFLGVSLSTSLKVDFEMIHLTKIPNQCKHITGLSTLFRSKITSNKVNVDQITAAVRFSYVLKNWTLFLWSQEPPTIDPNNPEDISQLYSLPIGSVYEPLGGLIVNAIWPQVSDNIVVDTDAYSDYDPLAAPMWTVSVKKHEDILCLLSDYIMEYLQFCNYSGTAEDLLGEVASRGSVSEYSDSLSHLTESKIESRIPKISNLLFSDSKRSFDEPFPKQILLSILYYLFPDTEKSKGCEYVINDSTHFNSQFKSCEEGSLVWRLAVIMVHVIHMFGGAKAATHLWHEFSQELRYRWNSGSLIPGVARGHPDTKTCLLHQKLQMLNCCIQRKIEHEQMLLNPPNSDDSEDEDEEFYDCDSEGERENEATPRRAPWDAPCGRLEKHPTLRLLDSNQPLYIPRTQGAIPKTEDQIEEDSEALMRLGPGKEGSLLRAKLMSASLLSDMESFKAANPGAVMADFIRWCSPRDWIEKDEVDEKGQKIGELSPRMLLPGNTWMEVWAAAKPVPARRQKRLFDETKEAERALHMIEAALPCEAGRLLLPVLVHAVANHLISEANRLQLPHLTSLIERFSRKAEARTRCVANDISIYQDMIQEVGAIESIISEAKSLEAKLQVEASDNPFIAELLTKPEAQLLPDSHLAMRIKSMFAEQHKVEQMLDIDDSRSDNVPSEEEQKINSKAWSAVSSKEVVLRAYTWPQYWTDPPGLPQRMAARVTSRDIVLAGAYCTDIALF